MSVIDIDLGSSAEAFRDAVLPELGPADRRIFVSLGEEKIAKLRSIHVLTLI